MLRVITFTERFGCRSEVPRTTSETENSRHFVLKSLGPVVLGARARGGGRVQNI